MAAGGVVPLLPAQAGHEGAERGNTGLPWQPQLARPAPPGIDPRGWLVSEKLDGVRALWDGQRLWLRGGTPVIAPPAFTAALPAVALDGELWAGRGGFEAVAGAVRRAEPDPHAWGAVTLQAFDLPLASGPFAERVARLHALRRGHRAAGARWDVPEQFTVDDAAALQRRLDAVVGAGGEGLMLHRADALWQGGRSGALLKLKPLDDAEATVVGHEPGRGRHAGRLGALRVRTDDGVTLRLGTGLSDAQRDDPPPLGARVTFAHQGVTDAGVPRFARFMRVRTVP